MKAWWSFPIGLVAAALVGYWFAQGRGETAHSAAAAASAENATESKALRALRGDVERLKNQARNPRVVYLAAEPARSGAEPAAVQAPVAKNPQVTMEEQHREIVTGLEARFAEERPDGEWSVNTPRALRSAVAASAPGSQVVEAACASTLCRVVLSHDSEETQKDLGSSVGGLEPFRAGIVYDYDLASTPRKTTLFVLRPGASFNDGVSPPR